MWCCVVLSVCALSALCGVSSVLSVLWDGVLVEECVTECCEVSAKGLVYSVERLCESLCHQREGGKRATSGRGTTLSGSAPLGPHCTQVFARKARSLRYSSTEIIDKITQITPKTKQKA